MRRLLISPHPDDIVWSCGGVLGRWAARDDVTVVTVFDGDAAGGAPARGATPAQRRLEDARALATWPLRAMSMGLAEASHRGGGLYYPGPMSRRRSPHPDDRAVLATVANAVAALVGEADAVLVPLGVRSHVDHTIVRAAVEAAISRVEPRPSVSYYLEFPYRHAPTAADGLAGREHPADFAAWLQSALLYESQVNAMFGGAAAFTRALTDHAQSASDGCVWRDWTIVHERGKPPDGGASHPMAESSERRSR